MAKVRVLQKSFINNQIVEEGEIVDYDGELGPNLEPLDGKKRERPLRPPLPLPMAIKVWVPWCNCSSSA